jgi:hypothetical protein
MTSPSPPTLTQPGEESAELTVRALIRGHRAVAAGAAAIVLITAALFLAAVLAPRNGAVVDSTSCSQWGSSSQSQQQGYALRYLDQHGNVPHQAPGVAGVEDAVNAGCMAAYASDEEDSVTVLDAIQKRY